MDRNQFWTLVEAADATSEEGCERLTGRLSTLSPEDIEGFARTLEELRAAAYRWDLWGAAYVANGGCSDDGFEYFRAWLVAQGRAVYEAASQDPDAIAAHVIPDDCECESLLYVAHEAYERRMRGELADRCRRRKSWNPTARPGNPGTSMTPRRCGGATPASAGASTCDL